MLILLDSYQYHNEKDKDKIEYYQNHKYTKKEQEKTKSIKKKIKDFVKIVREEDNFEDFNNYIESNICFFEGIGYISSINTDKNIVDIYFYGKTEEEAFFVATINYENAFNINYETNNKEQLIEDYNNRVFESNIFLNNYHGPFFFAELSLQDFRKYYKDNIPQDIINYYESYLFNVIKEDFKYDYETNRLEEKETPKKYRRFTHNKY